MMVDGRTFFRNGQGFAEYFRDAGWTVVVADFRGHGRSGPTPNENASWSYDDLVLRDLPALTQAVRQRHPHGPFVLVGHSLGGHTGLAAAGLQKLMPQPNALVLLSSNLWRPEFEPSSWRRFRKSVALKGLHFLVSRLGYFPSRKLRMGPCDESQDYMLR